MGRLALSFLQLSLRLLQMPLRHLESKTTLGLLTLLAVIIGLAAFGKLTAEAVQELQTQHQQSLGEMQEVAVELATAAASWLVGYAIDRDMFAVDELILKALEHLELNQSVKVRLHPADHTLLQTLLSDPVSRQQLDLVSCLQDESIPRGSVRVESGRRILLTDMHTRLEEIRRTWMEKLDDSQIERRGDGSISRTLRRFPERRETA